MAAYTCPSCGAALVFRASFSVYAVCEYCASMVVRTDRDVEAIGKMADLPEDISPLQLETVVTHAGQRYTLAGRLRVAWTDGAWNEWYMLAGDQVAWLAEAQGFFAISAAVAPDEAFLNGDLPRLDERRQVGDRSYRVTDIKLGTCVGSEGELPFRAPRGRVATYYDMIDDRGGFASIEDGADGRQLYAGRYVAFDDLQLEGMRQIEGWSVPATPAEPGRDPFLPPPA